MATAQNVAAYLLGVSQQHGDLLSNLKLQKFLYYAQAWHLALNNRPLFDERIEAWVHGPAVPPIYGEFKKWAWMPIETQIDLDRVELSEDEQAHLEEILDVYGGLSSYQLEKLTHSEDPWRNARGNIPPDEASNAIISHDDMKNYYRSINAPPNQAS